MSKIASTAASFVALIMALYHLVYTLYAIQGPIYHVNTHLMFSLLVVFLVSAGRAKKGISQIALLCAAVLASCAHPISMSTTTI